MSFRPLARGDFPLLLRWLTNPAVSVWWEAPPTTVHEIEGTHAPRVDGSERAYGYIAEYAGTPFGFIQWYRLRDHPDHPAVGRVADDAAGIDLYIGEDDFRHRGFGSVLIHAFLRAIVFAEADISACAIDPVPANHAAITAYRRAGFKDVGVVFYPAEREDVLIMVIDRADLISSGETQAAAEAPDADQDQKG
jgi:aminoglycoside 6'-N-acetyltransferase